MKILAFFQGWYGERIVEHVRRRAPDWSVLAVKIRKGLPALLDEEEASPVVEEILRDMPEGTENADLALFLLEEPGACLLIPELVRKVDLRVLICPVDDYRVLPRGLELQLSEELADMGVSFSFPRPFCSLSGGKGPIRTFAERFGRPVVAVEIDGREIKAVEVLRGAPCGSTHYMAVRLVGTSVDEAPSLAGLFVQTYPCLASHVEDPLLGEDMIHLS
ncbi:hypothetical protein DRO33_05500, partial [Candidatus Bathyarchaeota archaeon]